MSCQCLTIMTYYYAQKGVIIPPGCCGSFPKASIILAATCYQPRYQTLPIYLTGNTYTFAICSIKLLTYLLTYLLGGEYVASQQLSLCIEDNADIFTPCHVTG